MPIPTQKGQYRYVKYEDDGVSCYQCLWCLNTIRIADDPQYGWNFCPKCGKSWFKKLQCRDHYVPRWYYDRYGNHGPYEVPMYGRRPAETSKWLIEYRSQWEGREWSDWQYECSLKKDPCVSDYKWAYSALNQCRIRHDANDDFIRYEYRVRLVKI